MNESKGKPEIRVRHCSHGMGGRKESERNLRESEREMEKEEKEGGACLRLLLVTDCYWGMKDDE